MVVWLYMVKMTFSLDDATVDILRRVANRLQKPQSHVLREAIRCYEPHAGQLSVEERKQRVAVFDRVVAGIPGRSAAAVDRELEELRESRRHGWQRRSVPK